VIPRRREIRYCSGYDLEESGRHRLRFALYATLARVRPGDIGGYFAEPAQILLRVVVLTAITVVSLSTEANLSP
jgi:hypothetical protein